MLKRSSMVAPAPATGLALAMIAVIIVGSAKPISGSGTPVAGRVARALQIERFSRRLAVQDAGACARAGFRSDCAHPDAGRHRRPVAIRADGEGDDTAEAPDIKAAAVAAEAVVLMTLIWVAFRAMRPGHSSRCGLQSERAGILVLRLGARRGIVTVGAAMRAHRRLGQPPPRPFVPEHWRLGQLYNNPADPALFVPTRDGRRWTLNFGRPMAAALLGPHPPSSGLRGRP